VESREKISLGIAEKEKGQNKVSKLKSKSAKT
jgi:hypothetical protein